ncbi:hypothetical protein [Rhodoferax sp. WC2427]|uniref:hypothetical protein n=1 Tax=Rhodoferax sp. WC2427 TaxID=3234144 RepID=UPI0034668B79
MLPDENIAKAFETLHAAYRFDALGRVPHPENLKFRAEAEDWFMHRLGLQVVHIAEGEDQQWVGRTIQRYFWKELGHTQPVGEASEVPRFLLSPNDRMEPRIDLAELAEQMTGITLPKQGTMSIVASQLGLLQNHLHLSMAEVKWIKLAYASSNLGRPVHEHRDHLLVALQHVGLLGEGHRNRALAALLDEPLAAIEAMFRPPISLVALRFIGTAFLGEQRHLLNVATATDEFVELLESPHRSHAAILSDILEPEFDASLVDDGETPIGALYERFPQPIAECYERAVLGRPLNMVHIRQIVERYTGYAALPSMYVPLAERITFEGIREALKRAVLDCRIANQPITSHTLFKALYAAVA